MKNITNLGNGFKLVPIDIEDNIRIHNNQGIISKYKRSLKIKQFLKDES